MKNANENTLLAENIALLAQLATGVESHANAGEKDIDLVLTLYPTQTCENHYDVSLSGLRENHYTKNQMANIDAFIAMLEAAGIETSIKNHSKCEWMGTNSADYKEVYNYRACLQFTIPLKDLETKLKTLFREKPELAELIKILRLANLERVLKEASAAAELLPPVQDMAFKKSVADMVRNMLGNKISPD